MANALCDALVDLAGRSVLVLDWRAEVFGDDLLAQMCYPLPDHLTDKQGGESEACSLECVREALRQEQEVSLLTDMCAHCVLSSLLL